MVENVLHKRQAYVPHYSPTLFIHSGILMLVTYTLISFDVKYIVLAISYLNSLNNIHQIKSELIGEPNKI
jgi:hypothetical protein